MPQTRTTSVAAFFSPERTWRSEVASGLRFVITHSDPVLVALALFATVLWEFNPTQASNTLGYVAGELTQIAPWLTASVAIAAAARATGLDTLAARAFTGREGRMIIVASLIGALLPFCSCGVIPLVAGLLGAGVPLAPVMAFWIASPLMDPTQFFIAAGTLGVGFAVAKLVAAIGMGLLSGFGTMTLVRMRWLDVPAALRLPSAAATSSCCGSKTVTQRTAGKSCCGSASPASLRAEVVWRFWSDATRSQKFLTTATSSAWFLLRWLAVAYVLESLMIAWVPMAIVGMWLGSGAGLFAVPVAVAIGVPVYLNGFAAIPFVAGLIKLGMSPATGLAFMLASSATGFPAMVAVWALAKPRAFALYISFAVTGALLAGYAYTAVLAAGVWF